MARENLTKSADIQVSPRIIYLTHTFGHNWDHLRDIIGIMEPIKKQPGSILKSKNVTVTLQDGNVGEGEQIPLSKAQIAESTYEEMQIQKYQKEVSIEAINEHGYDNAVTMTDAEFLVELQNAVTDPFFQYINAGTLTASFDTFQMSLAMAKGLVLNEFKKMHRTATDVVAFVNVLDVYEYIGTKDVQEQSEFGFNYLKNFMGYRTVFLMGESEVKRGRVIATPTDNVKLYYVDPSNSDFARADLKFYTDGETNLIGFNTRGNYDTLTSVTSAIMGMVLFAEYKNAIAVVDVGENTGATVTVSPKTATVAPGGTQKFSAAGEVTWTVTGSSAVASGTKMADDGTLTVAATETNTTLTVKATDKTDTTKTGTATVTVATGG